MKSLHGSESATIIHQVIISNLFIPTSPLTSRDDLDLAWERTDKADLLREAAGLAD
ncbi:MAG: hypothetical protein KKD28_05255 [Chloroflexi bacterium]|nr:hypothetical protein [Chloroflexota bacterium]